MIDRQIFFDMVRNSPFPGALLQQQVDGMNGILDYHEQVFRWSDMRWLANLFAQTKWETSSTMQPVEEYGKGGSADYAKIDPQTGQGYWGRGLLQLTWRTNYARADKEMGWVGSDRCEWNADLQLRIEWSAPTAFLGMQDGWFRSSGGTPNTLAKYFNDGRDDPFEAREIVNGDKNKQPSWAAGATVGELIVADHKAFLVALNAANILTPPAPEMIEVQVTVDAPPGVHVVLKLTGGCT